MRLIPKVCRRKNFIFHSTQLQFNPGNILKDFKRKFLRFGTRGEKSHDFIQSRKRKCGSLDFVIHHSSSISVLTTLGKYPTPYSSHLTWLSHPSFKGSWLTKACTPLCPSAECRGSESSERTVCSVHDSFVATCLYENGSFGQVQQQLHYSYLVLARLQSFNHLNRKRKINSTMTSLIQHMFTESVVAAEGWASSKPAARNGLPMWPSGRPLRIDAIQAVPESRPQNRSREIAIFFGSYVCVCPRGFDIG